MRAYRVEVFADQRPIILDNEIVKASNPRAVFGRAYSRAKPRIKRSAEQITIRATKLGNV